ncbi:DUF1553 domain-containing protein [Stieleria varia]|uniref:Planctomycete cytochrome C n=1 Tax=Stieleria varia TaxID=2528005 RepID=A0A5C6A4J3_9BACT|nr:DUF1553 domain-containing protein [Stieleria varia]TWT93303.1 Planctomycete cytochrome C [Stieleria varia]
MPRVFAFFVITAVCLIAVAHEKSFSQETDAEAPQKLEFFEAKIRPVLIEQCYECHNSHETAEADLALDHRAPMLEPRDDGRLVVPGHPEQSRLLAIINHKVAGLEMPEGRPKLSESVLADFKKWIGDGAYDPRSTAPTHSELTAATSWDAVFQRRKQHWCWQPIRDVRPPAIEIDVVDVPLRRSPYAIDRFVAAKQREAGVTCADRADETTLVRRLYYTLIGLPPTPQQARQWTMRLREDHENGFGELVDELLASPHFGERWARHWMDWIRYAESHGSEGDPAIDGAWRYRDYLIRAFNADVPFDQLLREHIAGDLLTQPRINHEMQINESVIGTSHWRMVFHGFAPTDALEEKVRFTDDQVNSFSKAFLGLTVSCARCHDHKFDAISQADYYALYGILAGARPARHTIDDPQRDIAARNAIAELKNEIRRSIAEEWLSQTDTLKQRLEDLAKGDPPATQDVSAFLSPLIQAAKRQRESKDVSQAWYAAIKGIGGSNDSDAETTGHHLWDFADNTDYQQWHAAGNGLPVRSGSAGQFAIDTQVGRVLKGIYPAGVISNDVSSRDAARLSSPDIELKPSMKVWLQTIGEGESSSRYVVQDYPRNGTVYPVQNLAETWKWQSFDVGYWSGDKIHLELTTARDAPLLVKGTERSWFGIRKAMVLPADQSPPNDSAEILQPLLTGQTDPHSLDDVLAIYQAAITRAIRSWRDGKVDDSQALMLDVCLRAGLIANDLGRLPNTASLIDQYRRLESTLPSQIRVPGIEDVVERQQPLYIRGDHKHAAEVVPARFLSAVDAAPYDPATRRLQLADDMLRDDNPLTRRVIVNRLWHHLFGVGIVPTPDNFGELGVLPTHPELLDWLAGELSRNGGSMKSMIRSMVTSETWQLSSTVPSGLDETDPENTLLTHARIRRLDAEAIRDGMLAVSGTLDDRLFGDPVPGDQPRRSVYVRVIRNQLDPFLRVFDFPEPFATVGRRNATNVPAQSLTMLNNEFVSRLAGQWGARIETLPDDSQRLHELFWTAFGRRPTETEAELARAYLSDVAQQRQADQQALAATQQQLTQLQQQIDDIKRPIREQLAESLQQNEDAASSLDESHLIGRWDFRSGINDQRGTADAKLIGDASLSDEGLVVGPREGKMRHAVTEPIDRTIGEKTLMATVRLDDLNQSGGGVLSVQTRDGAVFDSIVFGEQQPGRWMSGSDHFRRTQPFRVPVETEASQRPVQLAIVYHADGRITAYRDGQVYGTKYRSDGPIRYPKNEWVISFGVRHLPANPGRMLRGTIQSAMIFDNALDSDQIEQWFHQTGRIVTDAMVLEKLAPSDRQSVLQTQRRIDQLSGKLDQLKLRLGRAGSQSDWAELARSMFLMKEFIYLR